MQNNGVEDAVEMRSRVDSDSFESSDEPLSDQSRRRYTKYGFQEAIEMFAVSLCFKMYSFVVFQEGGDSALGPESPAVCAGGQPRTFHDRAWGPTDGIPGPGDRLNTRDMGKQRSRRWHDPSLETDGIPGLRRVNRRVKADAPPKALPAVRL
jgi:hypothetical protein